LQSLLDEVIDNRSFIYTLGSLMYNGDLGPTSSYKRSLKTQHPQDKPNHLKAYEHFHQKTGFEPLKIAYPNITPSKAIEMVMIPVQASMRSHFRNAQVSI